MSCLLMKPDVPNAQDASALSKVLEVMLTDMFNMQKIHKIRITLTSRQVQSLEKVCQELIER